MAATRWYERCAIAIALLTFPAAAARAGARLEFDAEAGTVVVRAHLVYFTHDGPVDATIARLTTEEIARQWSGLGTRPGDAERIRLWIPGPRGSYVFRAELTHESGSSLAEARALALRTRDPSVVFVRLAKGAGISRTTELGGNTVILYEADLANRTTAAHEFGHVLGLDHRRQPVAGAPSIMYERGATNVEDRYRYEPGNPRSPLNPIYRRVTWFDVRDREFERYAPAAGTGVAVFGVAYADVWRGPGRSYYARVFANDARP